MPPRAGAWAGRASCAGAAAASPDQLSALPPGTALGAMGQSRTEEVVRQVIPHWLELVQVTARGFSLVFCMFLLAKAGPAVHISEQSEESPSMTSINYCMELDRERQHRNENHLLAASLCLPGFALRIGIS